MGEVRLNYPVSILSCRAAIVTDLSRSLVTRLAMHTESLTEEDEQRQQKIVHEPPR